MADVFTAPSDRIMFFVNDTSSVGSFVNVKNGATCQLQVKVHVSHSIDDQILSKMTSIEEDEEDCEEDTDEIDDLIQPPTKYDVMQALEVMQTCTFYDADVGDEMRAKVDAFSKLYDISMTKAKRQKAITDFCA